MKQMVLLSPTAILGYGFPAVSFENGLSCRPHVIAVDAGSTDPGPYYLGSGKPFVPAARSSGISPFCCGRRAPCGSRC